MSKTTVKPCWQILNAIREANAFAGLHILLSGPPDTGKSSWAFANNLNPLRDLCARGKRLSQYVATVGLQAGNTVTHPGPIVEAMQQGRILVLDEIDMLDSDCVGAFHAALDDSRIAELRLPNGEVIRPQSGFCVIATTNNPARVPEALRSRFTIQLVCDSPAPHVLAQHDAAQAAMLANTYASLAGFAAPPVQVCARALRGFNKLRPHLGDTLAAHAAFGSEATATEFLAALATASATANAS